MALFACYLDAGGGDGSWIIVEASNEDEADILAQDVAEEDGWSGIIDSKDTVKLEHGLKLAGPGF